MKFKICLCILLLFISETLEAQRERATRSHRSDHKTNMDTICEKTLIANSHTSSNTEHKSSIKSESLSVKQAGLGPVHQATNRILAPLTKYNHHQIYLKRHSKEIDDMIIMSSWIARILSYLANPVLYNMSDTSKIEINLYHVLLAGITEINSSSISSKDQFKISLIGSTFFTILKELGVLEDFQYFLLEQLGFHRNNLEPFQARSDGGLILDGTVLTVLSEGKLEGYSSRRDPGSTIQLNEDVTNMMDHSLIIREKHTKLLQNPEEQENPTSKPINPSHLFAAILSFENPIRDFLLDRLTDPHNFLERTAGMFLDNNLSVYQRRLNDLKMKLFPILISQATSPNYNFDIDSFMWAIYGAKKPISTHDYSFYNSLKKGLKKQTLTEIESHLAFNDNSQFGKIIAIKKKQEQPSSLNVDAVRYSPKDVADKAIFTRIAVLIEALDGKRYTYYYIVLNYGDDKKALLLTPDDISGNALYPIYYFDDIRGGSALSMEYFQQFQRNRMSHNKFLNPFSTNKFANSFREFFNISNHSPDKANDLQNSERRFISYINSDRERVPGQMIEIYPNGVVIKSLNGQTVTIEGEEQLNTIWQDVAVKSIFEQTDIDLLAEDNVQVIKESREGQFSDTIQVKMSGDPAKDAFRKGLIAGVLEGDQRFVSLEFGNKERRIAKVVAWDGDDIILQVYSGKDSDFPQLTRRTLFSEIGILSDFNKINVSQAAKDYFVRVRDSQDNYIRRLLIGPGITNTPIDVSDKYDFLSQTSSEVRKMKDPYLKMELYEDVVDWTDPQLQKWMRKATDLIEEKTGIRPGPQELNAHQRAEIYHVWFHNIVPLIESRGSGDKYGYDRDSISMIQRNNDSTYYINLGGYLESQTAVCKELSEFGVLLFSEYGLRTKIMKINPPKEHGHAWIKVHGNDFVEFIDSNGRKKIYTDIRFFLKAHYPQLMFTDKQKIFSLINEVNLVDPPS